MEKFTVQQQQGGCGRSSSRPLRRATYPAGVVASSPTPSLTESLRGNTNRFLGSSDTPSEGEGGKPEKAKHVSCNRNKHRAIFVLFGFATRGGRWATCCTIAVHEARLCSLFSQARDKALLRPRTAEE